MYAALTNNHTGTHACLRYARPSTTTYKNCDWIIFEEEVGGEEDFYTQDPKLYYHRST